MSNDPSPIGKAGFKGNGTTDGWKLVAWTSLAWLAILSITVAGFWSVLDRQDRKLELLLQRVGPASQQR